jgi:hypothetical protein
LDAVVLMKTFEAAAMEAAERQGFAVVMYGDLLSLSLGSPPLYIGLERPLAAPNTELMTWGNPRDKWGPKP